MKYDESSSLKAGIFVIFGLVFMIGAIIMLGQREHLWSKQKAFWTEFGNAQGLIVGADVRVAGVVAGTVRKVHVVEVSNGESVVRLELGINAEFVRFIREDSSASIRTLGPLGDKYVEIALGSQESPSLGRGEYIASQEPVDFYAIAEQMRDTLVRANRISRDFETTLARFNESAIIGDAGASVASVRRLLEGVENGPSLLHTLFFDPEMAKILKDFQVGMEKARMAAERVASGEGDLGGLIHGERLTQAIEDLAEASATVNRVLQEVETGNGMAHALVYGEERGRMIENVSAAAASARNVLEQIEQGDGMAHALIYEKSPREALDNLRSATERLDAVLADIDEGRGTLGLLITDPGVWESLTRILGGAEESRALKFLIRRSVGEREEDEDLPEEGAEE